MTLIKDFGELKLMRDTSNRIILTDDFLTDYIIFYPHNKTWACDGIFGYNRESIGEEVCKELDIIASKA